MFSCSRSLRVDVQRCPVVARAPKATPLRAMSRSALPLTITALLPPNSSSVLPSRRATTSATRRPVGTDPVNDTSGSRASWSSASPTSPPPPTTSEKMGGSECRSSTRAAILVTAMAVSGVLDDGFHTTASPATAAMNAFHDQTAHREVEGGDHPDGAQWLPLLVHAVLGALAGHGQPVELAGQPGGEDRHVDHLLDLAPALAQGLAGLQRHQQAQRILVLRQFPADLRDDLAPLGRRDLGPLRGRLPPPGDGLLDAGGGPAVCTAPRSSPLMGEKLSSTCAAPPADRRQRRPAPAIRRRHRQPEFDSRSSKTLSTVFLASAKLTADLPLLHFSDWWYAFSVSPFSAMICGYLSCSLSAIDCRHTYSVLIVVSATSLSGRLGRQHQRGRRACSLPGSASRSTASTGSSPATPRRTPWPRSFAAWASRESRSAAAPACAAPARSS